MKTEDWEAAAEKALREVLDADAVPTKSLDEFVAACMAERPGRVSALVEWLSAPRRAVAATVAGSFMITSMLVALLWCATGMPRVKDHRPTIAYPRMCGMLSLAETGQAAKGEQQDDL